VHMHPLQSQIEQCVFIVLTSDSRHVVFKFYVVIGFGQGCPGTGDY